MIDSFNLYLKIMYKSIIHELIILLLKDTSSWENRAIFVPRRDANENNNLL